MEPTQARALVGDLGRSGTTHSGGVVRAILLVMLVTCVAMELAAQQGQNGIPLGFAAGDTGRQRAIEGQLIAVPDIVSPRVWTRDLSARPHVAGTSAQAATRDYVIDSMRAWGLETWVKAYDVYIPMADTVQAWLVAGGGAPERLRLAEPAVPGNPVTMGPQVPPFNAYGADGDVTGPVVYVNYGLIEDYRTLDSMGIDVRGKIVMARYGRSFRGIKAREAERHGAAGLILYSDPQDDGYVRGDVYPKGPMRPAGGIQRGSILNVDGDPTTPGYASVSGVRRVPEESLPVPHIPVIPMSYGNAQRFLSVLSGPGVPAGWQGGLPFRYHVGPGPIRARVRVRREHGARAMHTIWDTFGMIRGVTYPDEWVVVGGHRDAWSPGAADDLTGTVTVLEAARAFAELARRGLRPARTVVFATWDAEEWGLIGSTEYVEEMADTLRARVVAYINEDDMAGGTTFGGGGSPSLKRLIREATQVVADPTGPGSVYDVWLRRVGGSTSALRLGNLGGGSDFAGFYHHLGIPAAGIGFGGPSGIYHSMYDSFDWMDRFGDPGWREHQAAARVVCVMLSRLANARVLPLDYVEWGGEMSGLVSQLDSGIARKGWSVSTRTLTDALSRFTAAADTLAAAREAALAGTADHPWARVNTALMQVERRFTRPQGLGSDPWFKSLQFASDVDNGYATLAFPSVNEAIRYGDAATTEQELADLVTRLDAARQSLQDAAAALR
jgi:N-acetylated-alpha-linked acidic dipeptidase